MLKTIATILRTNKNLILTVLCLGAVVTSSYFMIFDSDYDSAPEAVTVSAESESETEEQQVKPEEPKKDEVEKVQDEVQKQPQEVFEHQPIPQDVRDKMWDVTISEKSLVTYEDLAYLTITYMGYDGEPHLGNMIVDKTLAEEVLCIFKELYQVGFPIEKMRLPDEYDGVDELSMQDNNTSAYNDRFIANSNSVSYHQLGRAIDINPLVNPYIKFSTNVVLPANATAYLDRTLESTGMIKDDGQCVAIFKKYGWDWGGDWNSLKDYQHFEKKKDK